MATCATWLRAPARSAIADLGRAAIDDECAADACCSVGRRESEDIGVLIDPLVMANRECARGGRALRDDHHEAGRGDRQQSQRIAPSDVGQTE